jgi:hypothetical protein
MNHQPFEFWLLEDQPLDAEQKRELQDHLRSCTRCSALSETGLAFHTVRSVGPAAGFTHRFQGRLAAYKLAERRRKIWGMTGFIAGGLALLAWLSAPALAPVIDSPAEWTAMVLSYLFFLFASLQAVGEVGLMFLRVAPGFIPSFAWMVLASAMAGMGLLWIVSIWRLTYVPRGV